MSPAWRQQTAGRVAACAGAWAGALLAAWNQAQTAPASAEAASGGQAAAWPSNTDQSCVGARALTEERTPLVWSLLTGSRISPWLVRPLTKTAAGVVPSPWLVRMLCNAEIPVRRSQTRESTANEYLTMPCGTCALLGKISNPVPPPAQPRRRRATGQGGTGQGQGQQPPKASFSLVAQVTSLRNKRGKPLSRFRRMLHPSGPPPPPRCCNSAASLVQKLQRSAVHNAPVVQEARAPEEPHSTCSLQNAYPD